MKYIQLELWSEYRFNRDKDKYSQYQKYENNPQLVLTEVKEIIQGLEKETIENFRLFNSSIPAYTCAVLIRDFSGKLCIEEKEFCKEIIMGFASIPLKFENYIYQVSDGTEPAIISLPYLCKYFSKDKEEIKGILILLLLIDGEISTFATRAILNSLWEISFEDAHAILIGYLLIKPKYDDLFDEIRKESYKKNIYEISEGQILKSFAERYETELEKIIQNKVSYDMVVDLGNLDLGILIRAFELVPLRTSNEDHIKFVKEIFSIFSKKIFENDHYDDEERFDYSLKIRFLEKLAYFILTANKEMIETYIQPFVENFNVSSETYMLFHQFISAEDRLNQYEEFWMVWNAFYDKIVAMCSGKSYYYDAKEVVHNYLLAWPYWKETAKEWHTLKDREKVFFKKVADDIGYYPPVLYSISKVLNDIGSNFIEDGITWLSGIIDKNKNLFDDELEVNTIYYIENIVRKYIFSNRRKIKMTPQIKKQIIVILNFLIERGSTTGYLLRENIL